MVPEQSEPRKTVTEEETESQETAAMEELITNKSTFFVFTICGSIDFLVIEFEVIKQVAQTPTKEVG